MKFSIQFLSENGPRLGLLSGLKNNPARSFETPMSLIVTQAGSVPHLSKDVYNDYLTNDSLLCIPAQHFVGHVDLLQAYKKGISNFISMPNHSVCVVVQDPGSEVRSGYNDCSSVSTWSSSGRLKLTPESYIELIKSMLPDWYEALNDSDTSSSASKKRVQKSLSNSYKFLKQCQNLHESNKELKEIGFFAPLLGGHNPLDRRKWTESILEETVDGYCLLGLHENGTSPQILDADHVKKCVLASVENLPPNKVRQAQGAYSIGSILEMIHCGVDIFDSSLAYIAAENKRALSFPNTLESLQISSSSIEPQKTVEETTEFLKGIKSEEVDTESHQFKKLKTDSQDKGTPSSTSKMAIDLLDKRYADSKEALLQSCECYACTTFTKAYVHHLLSANEMLGLVLLMIHNLHHWQVFFDSIRKAIKTDQFGVLKTAINNYLS